MKTLMQCRHLSCGINCADASNVFPNALAIYNFIRAASRCVVCSCRQAGRQAGRQAASRPTSERAGGSLCGSLSRSLSRSVICAKSCSRRGLSHLVRAYILSLQGNFSLILDTNAFGTENFAADERIHFPRIHFNYALMLGDYRS